MLPIDGGFLQAVAPRFAGAAARAQQKIIAAVGPALAATLGSYAVNTHARIAHFTAQICHESAGFRTTEEFASGRAYEGRIDLGNLRTGDGPRFKGRGLLQLTGRANYRRIGEKLGLDLEDKPQRAAEPIVSLKIACEYWKDLAVNAPADADDLVRVTRLVNGGLNGFSSRKAYLEKAKAALARLVDPLPVLRRGACGEKVGVLQDLLRRNGFALASDKSFGPATEAAVKLFQPKAGLFPDGIVGPKTWAALDV